MTTPAQRRAVDKYRANVDNADKIRRVNYRSHARRFILDYANQYDLSQVKLWMTQRKQVLDRCRKDDEQ